MEAYTSIKDRFKSSPEMANFAFPMRALAQVRASLHNAWGTELLLCLGRRFLEADEVVRLSNNWNVVQAYYALYHAIQALTIARGNERPNSHPKTQNCYIDFWSRLPEAFTPWSLSVGANGHEPAALKIDPDIHAWSIVTSANCSSLACKALRTTRDDFIAEKLRDARVIKQRNKRREWRAAEKLRIEKGRKPRKEPTFPLPRLNAEENEKVRISVRSFSALDYLYRLRIRSNYIDAGMFTDGPEGDTESSSVRDCLVAIVSTSLYASELMLATFTDGCRNLNDWGKEWSEANLPHEINLGVKQRLQLW